VSKNSYPGLLFFDRFAYTTQILASRRFSEKLSLEIAPIYVRQNVVDLNFAKTTISNTESLSYFLFPQPWNQLLLAVGGRYKLTKRLSVNMDYAYNFSKNKNALYQNPLTMGMDIETGGHVFQLLFTNSRASNDGAFLTEALGDWSKGDISFGFNILRVF
jgi:predicted porin